MKTKLSIAHVDICRNRKSLIQNINFTFNAGQSIAIVGNNGSGKTTLLKTLAGLLPLPKGVIAIDDQDIHQMPSLMRALKLSFLLQTSPIQPYCLAKDRIAHGLMPLLGINHFLSDEEYQRVEKIAEALNISHLLDRPLCNMSGGEHRLVNIAKCLVNPELKVILLDEPSVFLDMTQKSNLARLLKQQTDTGRIALFSSHDMDFIRACSTQTLAISDQIAQLV